MGLLRRRVRPVAEAAEGTHLVPAGSHSRGEGVRQGLGPGLGRLASLRQARRTNPADLPDDHPPRPQGREEGLQGTRPRPPAGRRPSATRRTGCARVGQRHAAHRHSDARTPHRPRLADRLPAPFLRTRPQPGRGRVGTSEEKPGQPRCLQHRPAGRPRQDPAEEDAIPLRPPRRLHHRDRPHP